MSYSGSMEGKEDNSATEGYGYNYYNTDQTGLYQNYQDSYYYGYGNEYYQAEQLDDKGNPKPYDIPDDGRKENSEQLDGQGSGTGQYQNEIYGDQNTMRMNEQQYYDYQGNYDDGGQQSKGSNQYGNSDRPADVGYNSMSHAHMQDSYRNSHGNFSSQDQSDYYGKSNNTDSFGSSGQSSNGNSYQGYSSSANFKPIDSLNLRDSWKSGHSGEYENYDISNTYGSGSSEYQNPPLPPLPPPPPPPPLPSIITKSSDRVEVQSTEESQQNVPESPSKGSAYANVPPPSALQQAPASAGLLGKHPNDPSVGGISIKSTGNKAPGLLGKHPLEQSSQKPFNFTTSQGLLGVCPQDLDKYQSSGSGTQKSGCQNSTGMQSSDKKNPMFSPPYESAAPQETMEFDRFTGERLIKQPEQNMSYMARVRQQLHEVEASNEYSKPRETSVRFDLLTGKMKKRPSESHQNEDFNHSKFNRTEFGMGGVWKQQGPTTKKATGWMNKESHRPNQEKNFSMMGSRSQPYVNNYASQNPWAKKKQLHNTRPVATKFGLKMLQKMGWAPGQGLGKNKKGALEPICFDVKMDRKGFHAKQESAPKKAAVPVLKELNGKHPVSALIEMCTKREWPPPDFQIIYDFGPDHKKNFLMKVIVNGHEFRPSMAASSKKSAKANAAAACLSRIHNIFPEPPPKKVEEVIQEENKNQKCADKAKVKFVTA